MSSSWSFSFSASSLDYDVSSIFAYIVFIQKISGLSISLIIKGPDCFSNFDLLQLYRNLGPFQQSSTIFAADIPRLLYPLDFQQCSHITMWFLSFLMSCLYSSLQTVCNYLFLESSVTQLDYHSMQPICLSSNK